MWFENLRRNLTGSGLSLKEREVLALEEHNALLRAQLELQGAKNLPKRVLTTHPTKRTERDITRITRESIWEQQQKAKGEASRPWNKPSPKPTDASTPSDTIRPPSPDSASTFSTPDRTNTSDPSSPSLTNSQLPTEST